MVNVQFQLTNNAELLSQYHVLRFQSYHSDKHMQGHFNKGIPDSYDTTSEVIVAVENGEVIAGARLTTSDVASRQLLPSESDELRFEDMLPHLGLGQARYGEVHRVVIKEEKRSARLLSALLMAVCKRIYELEWDYFFTPSIALKARLYQICCKGIGVNLELVPNMVLTSSKYDQVAMQMMFCDIRNQPLYKRFDQSQIEAKASSNSSAEHVAETISISVNEAA